MQSLPSQPLKYCSVLKGSSNRRSTLLQATSVSALFQHPQLATVKLQQYDDCELLWLQYGKQLSLSKSAIYWSLQDVQLGHLPCDAELLKGRAAAFAALGQQHQVPGLDALRVLNSCRHALHHEPEHVRQTLSQLLQLLPGSNPTQLLLDTLADLDLPTEILALQHQEVNAVFKASLKAHAPPKALHHMLQRWRQQQHSQQVQPSMERQGSRASQDVVQAVAQQRQWPGGMQPVKGLQAQGVESSTSTQTVAAGGQLGSLSQRSLKEQLAVLAEVLGREVVHVAVGHKPELLDAEPASILANLQWLQEQLQLSPVAALLLAGSAGDVLLLPCSVLEARYSNICYLLLQLLGWKLRQVHTLLCNAPQLLGCESARLASNWQLVQQLARRRSVWLEELATGSQTLVSTVLCAEQRQLQQLRYAAEARELRGLGLAQVLRQDYVDFLQACSGFRIWRNAVPAEKQRWSLVDEGCVVEPDAGSSDSLPHAGKVLAADKKGRPVLLQIGERGPLDRLL